MTDADSPPRLLDAAFDGPVDIVGDVHGEIDALEDLLRVLGYRGRGEHRAVRWPEREVLLDDGRGAPIVAVGGALRTRS